MPILPWLLLATLGVVCVAFLILAAIKTEKPLKQFATSGAQGLCALGLLNALAGVTGVSVGFSWLALGVSTIFGMPGVIGMVTLTTIMNM